MERKILLLIMTLIVVLVIASLAVSLGRQSGEKFCETDNDCACGVRVGTGECFFGNRNFVDASRQCPDFCNGIAANLATKCVDKQCVQVNVRQ